MLGGHPELFAPPELLLLNYDTVDERHRMALACNSLLLRGDGRRALELALAIEAKVFLNQPVVLQFIKRT